MRDRSGASPTKPTPPQRPTAPLGPVAVHLLHRLELALAPTIVANLDHYGTLWGHSTTQDTETEIAEARTEGATVDEWKTTSRDGQPLRIVRVDHPKYGIDIRHFTGASLSAVAQ